MLYNVFDAINPLVYLIKTFEMSVVLFTNCHYAKCFCIAFQTYQSYFSGISFDTMYRQYYGVAPTPMAPLEIPIKRITNTDKQQNKKLLNCGYCNVQCNAVPGLVKHCKQDRHKYAVFADCGRDVLWQFEPPPLEKSKISTTLHR